ncbi:MAG: hypothetical protein PVH92_04595 [Anaerolineales bacterium]
MQQSSMRTRYVMAGVAVLVGLFLIAVAPWIVQTSLDRVLEALIKVSQERPQFESGISLFNFFYPLWRAIGFVAGVVLLVLAFPVSRGETWTYPTALVATAVPSISGMFMFLPYISWVGGFPLPMVISWVGLFGFWMILLLPKSTWAERGVKFVVFTFIGMLATHSFTLGIGSQRMLATRPMYPLYDGLEWWILTIVGEVDWIATLLLIVALPLLALRKRAGWWVALIASLAVLLIDVPTQIVRTKTFDYLYGALIAAGLLLFLLLPGFKRRLLGDIQEKTIEV